MKFLFLISLFLLLDDFSAKHLLIAHYSVFS